MKTYEIINQETGVVIKAISGEQILWIPNDPANNDYAEYLRYTAWVEDGNAPEDFWTQNNV